MKLPFYEDTSALKGLQELAHNGFLSVERKLLKDPSIRAQYMKFMEEYKQMEHMTEININSILISNYFIPPHCVLE